MYIQIALGISLTQSPVAIDDWVQFPQNVWDGSGLSNLSGYASLSDGHEYTLWYKLHNERRQESKR